MGHNAVAPPITSAERDALLAALAANFARYYLTYSTLPGGTRHGEGALRWFSGGVPEPWFNGVLDKGTEASAPTTVARIVAHFARLRLPFLWHCPPNSAAREEAPLLAHGLRPFADEPGMALDLATLPHGDALPAGLTIERVKEAATLRGWTAIWMDGVPEPTRQRCRAAYHALGPAAGDYSLGRLAGVPVATVKLFDAAGVVSVQHVMTLPAARRRGIGGALVGHVLRQARARGARFAVLTATPAGLSTYARLGFREVCRCKSFLWTPDA